MLSRRQFTYFTKKIPVCMPFLSVSVAATSTPSAWDERKLYLKTCRKLCVRPIPMVSDALQAKSKEIAVRNRCMNALDMLSVTNTLIVSVQHTHS